MTKISRGPTLSDQVFLYIRQRIINGQYSAGDVIVESELANELDVSRTPVSNAVVMLKERGLIEERHGRFRILDLTIGDVIDLYQCRLAFDGLAARLASSRITKRELARLESLLDAWERPIEEPDPQALWVADLSFHELIYKASHNAHLVRFSEIATDLLSTYRRVILESLSREENVKRTQLDVRTEHERILVALSSRDEDLSEQAAREHIQHIVDYLECAWSQVAPKPGHQGAASPASA